PKSCDYDKRRWCQIGERCLGQPGQMRFFVLAPVVYKTTPLGLADLWPFGRQESFENICISRLAFLQFKLGEETAIALLDGDVHAGLVVVRKVRPVPIVVG